jgi:hypothetical protein
MRSVMAPAAVAAPAVVGRVSSIVIAAADSYDAARASADYRAPGVNDHAFVAGLVNDAATGLIRAGAVTLRAGTYSLGGPLLIDRDWVTLQGESRPFWSRYLGPFDAGAVNVPGAPGGAKLLQTVAGLNGIEVGTANLNGDTRHKGLAFRDLYLAGPKANGLAYGGTGIYDGANTDFSVIEGCQVEGWAAGIDVAWDSPTIVYNSVQAIGGFGIKARFVFGNISGNLVFDLAGPGIWIDWSTTIAAALGGARVVSNIIGNVTGDDGIVVLNLSGHPIVGVAIAANHLQAIHRNGIALGLAHRCAVSGNTIELSGIFTPYQNSNSAGHGISLGVPGLAASNNNTIVGNTISNQAAASSTGFAVAMLHTSTNNAVTGNAISGTAWNGGGSNVQRGSGNVFQSNAGET